MEVGKKFIDYRRKGHVQSCKKIGKKGFCLKDKRNKEKNETHTHTHTHTHTPFYKKTALNLYKRKRKVDKYKRKSFIEWTNV